MPILQVQAEMQNLAVIRRFVEETAEALHADSDVVCDVIQAVDESATNIIIHGYRGRPGDIEIEVTREQSALVVKLLDHAPLFDPTTVPLPDLTSPLEHRRLGGLGVHLARQFTDKMSYRVTAGGGNELTFLKYVNWPEQEENK